MKRALGFWALLNLVSITAGAAEWSSRNSFDLGYTSNANLTKDSPVSDEYIRVATADSMKSGQNTYGVRLSYADYFKASENDAFGLRLSDVRATTTPWKVNSALVSRIYTHSSPGTTDTSFTNVGIDLSASRLFSLLPSAHQEFEAGYRMRYYTAFQGRSDHNLFASADLEKELSDRLTLGGNVELGFLGSSLSEYSRLYFDLGGSVDYQFAERWDWLSEVSLGENSYTSRTTSTETIVNQRRGKKVATTGSAAESYLLLTLSTEVTRRQTRSFRWGFGLYAMNQSSKSGALDFTSLDALARLIWSF